MAGKNLKTCLCENYRDEKSEALRREKTQYTPGLWNVNTILMGGLGRDPEPESRCFSLFHKQ